MVTIYSIREMVVINYGEEENSPICPYSGEDHIVMDIIC
jgi:hypothetical protein